MKSPNWLINFISFSVSLTFSKETNLLDQIYWPDYNYYKGLDVKFKNVETLLREHGSVFEANFDENEDFQKITENFFRICGSTESEIVDCFYPKMTNFFRDALTEEAYVDKTKAQIYTYQVQEVYKKLKPKDQMEMQVIFSGLAHYLGLIFRCQWIYDPMLVNSSESEDDEHFIDIFTNKKIDHVRKCEKKSLSKSDEFAKIMKIEALIDFFAEIREDLFEVDGKLKYWRSVQKKMGSMVFDLNMMYPEMARNFVESELDYLNV